MTFPAYTFKEAVDLSITASNQLHTVINGSSTTEITIEDGSKIPSLKKVQVEHEAEHDAQINAHEVEHDLQIAAHKAEFLGQLSTMGWLPVAGSFETGGTLTLRNNILLQESTKSYYQWMGILPKVVSVGSLPSSDSNWVIRHSGMNTIQPYQPSVNPSLDLDFAKQKYRWYAGAAGITESSTPSLMTFTRSSVATFFDAMGVMKQAAVNTPRIDYDPLTGECNGLLVEEQRTNLRSYSTYPLKVFGTSNAILTPAFVCSPSGTLDVGVFSRSITGNGSYGMLNPGGVTIGTQTAFCFSLYVKKQNARYVSMRIQEATVYSSACDTVFDLDTGTVAVDATVVGEYTEPTSGITQVGGGWFRVWIKAKTGSLPAAFGLLSCSDMATARVDGIAGTANLSIYYCHPQLEVGAFPTSYIPTPATFTGRASTATYLDANGVLQTAASGVARSAAYDYDADGVLRPIGLLLEGAATNLLLYSEQFDNAAWTKLNATITANAVTAPDGNTTADKLVDTAVSGYHYASQSVSASASTTYTKSVYLKAGERSWAKLELYDGSSYLSAYFNLSTGSIGTISSGASASISKANNGFWRCTITATTSASATTLLGTTHVTTGDAAGVYTGDGTSGIYAWGAQLASGSYATSYIQTTSAQVTRAADTSTSAQATRAADNASISGANFSQWYKQYEGTVVVGVNNQTTTTTSIDSSGYGRGCAVLSDGTDINRIRIGNDAGISFAIKKGGVDQASQTVGVVSVGKHKGALSFATNNINAAVDAVSAIQDVSASIPYLTQLHIGKSTVTAGLGGTWSSHIRTLKYFPKALTSAELQAMTA